MAWPCNLHIDLSHNNKDYLPIDSDKVKQIINLENVDSDSHCSTVVIPAIMPSIFKSFKSSFIHRDTKEFHFHWCWCSPSSSSLSSTPIRCLHPKMDTETPNDYIWMHLTYRVRATCILPSSVPVNLNSIPNWD